MNANRLPPAACTCRTLLLGVLLVAGCQAPPPPTAREEPTGPPWFADVADQVGLHFVHDAGPAGTYFMPHLMGSRAALFYFATDGFLPISPIPNRVPHSAPH